MVRCSFKGVMHTAHVLYESISVEYDDTVLFYPTGGTDFFDLYYPRENYYLCEGAPSVKDRNLSHTTCTVVLINGIVPYQFRLIFMFQ